jgi:hypothetical protein
MDKMAVFGLRDEFYTFLLIDWLYKHVRKLRRRVDIALVAILKGGGG